MCVTFQLQAPDFSLECINGENYGIENVRLSDFVGHWLTLVFYPRDFSFVATSELIDMSVHHEEFQKRECRLLGLSVDPMASHQEWLETARAAGGLGGLKFPLASDPKGQIAKAYGVWNRERQSANSGLFVIDPQGVVQHATIHNPKVGRSAMGVLQVLDALQANGLCPATWVSQDEPVNMDEALHPGQVFGQYRLHHQLGDGTFGKVFAGEDLRQGRDVAVKFLKHDAGLLGQTGLAEVKSTLVLSHPNICTVYSVDEIEGVIAIAMESLSGQPMSAILDEPLSESRVCHLAGQIASALAMAHEKNIVHGDLKPANLRILPYDVVKVMDFCIARTYRHKTPDESELTTPSQDGEFNFEKSEDSDETTMIQLKHVVGPDQIPSPVSGNTLLESDGRAFGFAGTPGYMSPEQSQGKSATRKSDTFSLGVLLFEMLTGTRAFSEKSLVVMIMHLQDTSLGEEMSAKVPVAFQDLLCRMLDNNPDNRPAMNEVAEQLQQIV